jgi:O-antigen ligase
MFSGTVAARLLLLALGLASAAVLAVRERGVVRALPPVWLPFVLWAAWSMLSLAWSIEPPHSARELKNEVGYAAAALWVCFVAAQARRAQPVLLAVFAAASVVVCGIAIFEYSRGWDYYITGAHGAAGNFSSTLLVLTPCALMAFWFAREASWPKALRVAPLALGALFLAAAYTTESRTIWIALAAEAAVCLGLLALRARRPLSRRSLALGLLVAAGIAGAAAAMTARVQVMRESVGAHAMTDDPRLKLWPEVLESIEARPLLGYGFGRGVLRYTLRSEMKEAELWHAHNLFLDAALQTGLPGAALLAALFAALLWQGWRFAGDPGSPAAAACGVALCGIVTGVLVRNMTDTLLVRQNALLFWATVGVLLAWGARAREPGG